MMRRVVFSAVAFFATVLALLLLVLHFDVEHTHHEAAQPRPRAEDSAR